MTAPSLPTTGVHANPRRHATLLTAALCLVATIILSLTAESPIMADDAELSASSVAADGVKVVDKSKVYYPATIKKDAKFSAPATIASGTVFKSIPEWAEIKKRKLTTSDAAYHLLLKKANVRFHKALSKAQKAGKWDIVAESGAISAKGITIVDATQKVVDALPK